MENLKKEICEALGEASMAWSETPIGTFDSEKCIKIADRLLESIKKVVEPIDLTKVKNAVRR